MIDLTGRQEEFVRNLVELYRQGQSAVHYTELAERLGVSRFTAYDMLRLLEEKGLVASRYELDEARSGPGRSTIVYEPTAAAHELMAHLLGAEDDWAAVRQRIDTLGKTNLLGNGDLAREIQARVPVDAEEDVAYCIEVMTIIALRLSAASRDLLVSQLPRLQAQSSCRIALSLLSGFALGLMLSDTEESHQTAQDDAWLHELYDHVHTYQHLVLTLPPERCTRLAQHLETTLAEVATI